jgi:two-component system chemotaxis response regulator CheB
MPRNAMQAVAPDLCVPKEQLGALIGELAREAGGRAAAGGSDTLKHEVKIEAMNMEAIENDARPGQPSAFACPECGGVLWELHGDEMLRFRCRVGHAFGPEALIAAQADQLDGALWSALRALEENASLNRRLAGRARGRKAEVSAAAFETRARNAEEQAEIIRRVLSDGKASALGEGEPAGEKQATS